ncbi:uncharacterized protein LOC108908569 [Anoplophora glabripennis]|uniref:uncharacterized protein LOC108908569 n=1 Tax=Anoplophora glabripennis TaxID=217634 RepID=UPI000873910E|nr:uncharacterized protein LOC108908569 [Anoplophora glabripennis]
MNSRENLLKTRSVENRDSKTSEIRNIDQRRSSPKRLERVNSRVSPLQRRTITNQDRRVTHPTDRLEIQNNRKLTDRSAREDRTRDQSQRETRQFNLERRDQRFSERQDRLSNTIKTTDRLQRTSEDRISLQRREGKTAERRASETRNFSRENRLIDNRQLSRSDSTRYIQDNINSRDIRLTHRTNSARDIKENSRREITDRYNPLTADSRRYFEKIVSQRTTRDSVRNTETPALGLERNINNNDAYTWINTAKIILAAFLVGQIFVNSSKANRFRFHNMLSVVTSIKEKLH